MERAGMMVVVRIALLIPLLVSVPTQGQDADTSALTGKGSVSLSQWGVSGASGERQFNLQFRSADTSELFTGSIRVTGVDGFNGGSLGDADWKLDGSRLTGKVAQGERTVVTFEGTVGEKETSGTFTTAGGRTGSWIWEGPPPGE